MTNLLLILLLVGNFAYSQCPGDVNEDNSIDIFDIIGIVNFILLGQDPDFFHLYKSDFNKNGDVDIEDILLAIDLILLDID